MTSAFSTQALPPLSKELLIGSEFLTLGQSLYCADRGQVSDYSYDEYSPHVYQDAPYLGPPPPASGISVFDIAVAEYQQRIADGVPSPVFPPAFVRPSSTVATRASSPVRSPSPVVLGLFPSELERINLPRPLAPLDILANVATLASRQATPVPTSPIFVAPLVESPRPISPISSFDLALDTATPELQYPDPLSPSQETFGLRSPSYHVRSPTPRSPLAVTPSLASPPPVPRSTPLPTVEIQVDQVQEVTQEDRPALQDITAANILDLYAVPDCIANPTLEHPHQSFIVLHDNHDEWRPIGETGHPGLLAVPYFQHLLEHPLIFPTVTPFKGRVLHHASIAPTDLWQAQIFDIPTLHFCSRAGHFPSTPDVPLGYTVYCFRASLKALFLGHSQLVRNIFVNALVVSQVYDFLDGHRIFVYGKLQFGDNSVYITDQAVHFEDIIASYPQLLRHCITPRLPPDPSYFVHLFSDHTPL